jgi:hypothetical protein
MDSKDRRKKSVGFILGVLGFVNIGSENYKISSIYAFVWQKNSKHSFCNKQKTSGNTGEPIITS